MLKTGPVGKFLILHRIKLEKNGFHSLKERQISFHTIYISYLKTFYRVRIQSKAAVHQLIKFRRQIDKNRKTAHVCRLLILQQIKLEKNGFHSLKERQNSFQTMQDCHLNTCILLE